MALYAIADLHLSLGTDKPMDIFKGWENYVERLEENWMKKVLPEDTVVIPGDISWGMTMEQAKADFAFIHGLSGKKIILKGNHDYWFSTKNKTEQFWAQNGFDSLYMLFNNTFVYEDYCLCGTRGWMNEKGEQADKKVLLREAGRLRLSLQEGEKTGKEPIVFLHYPPVYASDECYEILAVLKEFGVKRCYYGHIHGYAQGYAINGERNGIDFRLISGDYIQFDPVKIL